MITIENDVLSVSISTRGAELQNIFNKTTGLEYLWDGNPEFWAKRSPVLFPIVGALKNNTYYFNDKAHNLSRHGFARERDFECISHEYSTATFSLGSDDETLKVYPFTFRLNIIYSLNENKLTVTYQVVNTGKEVMHFSIGAHPAFKIPLEKNMSYDDYLLEFSNTENAMRWLISPEGLIEPSPVPFLKNDNSISLTKELFQKDAIVFKYLNSETIRIRSDKSQHGITFQFDRFPFFGIWAAPNADFVCLEPWCGIADSTTHDQQLTRKEGINDLAAGQQFERWWSVEAW